MGKSLKIIFISPPMTSSNVNQVLNCTNILASISDTIYIILSYKNHILLDNNKYTYVFNIVHKNRDLKVARVVEYITTQIKIAKRIFQIRKKVDICFFFMGDGLIIPIITAKMLNKKVILLLGGSQEDVVKYNKSISNQIILVLKNINLKCSNQIIVYSPILIEKWNLQKYKHKIAVAHKHYIDFNEFYVIKDYEKRNKLVGYIGYLDELKGVTNFVEAFIQIVDVDSSVNFLICGKGPLEDDIKQYCFKEELTNKTKIIGWTEHNELIYILNELKLLILPSNSEGLPNIILESMACGTPVLTTPVGAIPDIVEDGKTGFIMENNSVECIQSNILRALNHENLNQVSMNGRTFVESKFSYNSTLKIFSNVFRNI